MSISKVGFNKLLPSFEALEVVEAEDNLVGDSIGRSKSEDTHMTLEALKPALDKWVALMVNQIAPTH